MKAFQPEEDVQDGPDGELIRLCNRVMRIRAAIDAVDGAFSGNDGRSALMDLVAARFEAVAKVRELDGPTTAEGARVVALVLLSPYPGGVCPLDRFSDWLSVRCAEYLAGRRRHDGQGRVAGGDQHGAAYRSCGRGRFGRP